MRHWGRIRADLKLILSELWNAAHSSSSWFSFLCRSALQILAITFFVKWLHQMDEWTFTETISNVVASWPTYLSLCYFGATGRAIDDRTATMTDIARALGHQLLVLPTMMTFWGGLGLLLRGIGYTDAGTGILVAVAIGYALRVISADTDKVLSRIPKSERKRGFATYEGDFPRQTR